ncbi:MAG TPA: GDSL-type esterase/lipase family protein [Dokdonella sp.]
MPDADRFLALGDSYTIGEGVAGDAGWPAQLVRGLHEHGVAIAAPEIVATTGWTTDELSAAMDGHAFSPPYALVTLLIGVNDQYRGLDRAAYPPRFARLLERAIALAGGRAARTLAISIPDWGATRFARERGDDAARTGAEIDAYNDAARAIAAAHGVAWIDVTAASRAAGAADAMLAADGLHPSAAQYARWTAAILPAALRALSAAA